MITCLLNWAVTYLNGTFCWLKYRENIYNFSIPLNKNRKGGFHLRDVKREPGE